MSVSNLGASSNQTQAIADAYKKTQQFKLDAIKVKQTDLEGKQRFFNNLNSRLNGFVSELDKFDSESIESKFTTKKASSSSATVATATANSEAANGVSSIRVNQLATNDRLLSNRLVSADTFGLTGTKQIELEVNGNPYKVDVTFTGTETNAEALKKISSAINKTTGIKLSTSVVKDTSTTSRFVFTSSNTGEENKLKFKDGEVFAALGITEAGVNSNSASRTAFTNTTAGFAKASTENLNAKAEINGIEVSSNTNTLNDVLSGVTVTLLKAQEATEAAVNLTIEEDVDSVKSFVESTLNQYNGLLQFSRSDRKVTRSESAINSLGFTLRSVASSKISGTSSTEDQYLSSIGITADRNGILSISNLDTFKEVLKENPIKIKEIFTASDGIVAKLRTAVQGLRGDNGLVKSKNLSLSRQITDFKAKFDSTSAQIEKQSNSVKKQYESTLKVYLEAQGKYSSFGAINGQG